LDDITTPPAAGGTAPGRGLTRRGVLATGGAVVASAAWVAPTIISQSAAAAATAPAPILGPNVILDPGFAINT
jgi:hypothetical protein